jgi:hypothetical protein
MPKSIIGADLALNSRSRCNETLARKTWGRSGGGRPGLVRSLAQALLLGRDCGARVRADLIAPRTAPRRSTTASGDLISPVNKRVSARVKICAVDPRDRQGSRQGSSRIDRLDARLRRRLRREARFVQRARLF